MTKLRFRNRLILGLGLSLCSATFAHSQSSAPDLALEENNMRQAKGTFEVNLTPQKGEGDPDDALLGRMSIDKTFYGDLEGTSQGQMLSARTATQGSAGYVAIEKVSGTLQGRQGTFVLQHSATMNQGVPSLSVMVVPDSGTGQLEGLAGAMTIIIEDGKHLYEFEHNLPE